MLALMHEFFPRQADGAPDTTADPQVSDPNAKRWILNEVGLCLMSLGRLRDAVPFDERHNAICAELGDWHNASIGYINLAELHLHLGDLASGATAARQALELARKAENQEDERTSLAWLAWAEHLRGDTPAALDHFAQAEALEKEIDSRVQYLYSLRGIQHADALIRLSADPPIRSSADSLIRSSAETLTRFDAEPLAYAHRITEANLEICERNRWGFLVSMCHRVLGDLAAAAPIPTPSPTRGGRDARDHYDEALRIARTITRRDVLIEALIARGGHTGKARVTLAEPPAELLQALNLDQAFTDLREALELSTRGGYRRYEADARVALAWAHLAAGDPIHAREEAQRAHALSTEMGYRWGVEDAGEVIAKIEVGD